MGLWDTLKDTAWDNKGKIATASMGPLGLAGGAIFDRDYGTIGRGEKFEDLPWYDRVGLTLKAKGESLLEGTAGFVGLEEEVGHSNQDLLAGLKHEVEDDYGTSFDTGGSITGGSGGDTPKGQMGGGSMGEPNNGYSLGRALASEKEPALEGQNFNKNNFNF